MFSIYDQYIDYKILYTSLEQISLCYTKDNLDLIHKVRYKNFVIMLKTNYTYKKSHDKILYIVSFNKEKNYEKEEIAL